MDSETLTYVILGVGGAIALGSFVYFIFVPALGAYGRVWEKLAASVLTLFVAAAFVGSGLGAGLVLVYYWDSIAGVFGAIAPI
jgi:hypothetical protein